MVKGHLPCCSTKRNWDSLNACSWKSSANGFGTMVPSASKTQTINKCNNHVYYECKKVREEVILGILAQESLNLELWLERYEDLELRGQFCEISRARDLSGIISQNPGA
jgi:hypothetical protein